MGRAMQHAENEQGHEEISMDQITPAPPIQESTTLPSPSPSPSQSQVQTQTQTQPQTFPNETPTPTPTIPPEPTLTLTTSLKLISACFAFFVAGINDGSLGSLIPYLLTSYTIRTSSISIIYASSFCGWVVAALIGGIVRISTGPGGTLISGAGIQLLAQVLRVWKPPFPLFCITFFLVSVGQAFQDSQANTFVSSIKAAHRWLGVIHASYSIGLLIGPLVATTIASSAPSNWSFFYYFPLGLGFMNLGLVGWSFWDEVRVRFVVPGSVVDKDGDGDENGRGTGRGETVWKETKETLRRKVVWLLSLFYFFHLGAAFTAGGWLVEYLVQIRHIALGKAGYIPTAFYGGTALGRLLLPEPTHRFGEKKMLLLYSILCCALQVVFWRVDNLVSSAVVVTGMGFLLGPNFATGISVATKLIPREIHASALGLIFVIAQAGAAVFPAVTGVIAAKAGVGTLQPVLVGLLVAMALSWALVPNVDKRKE